MKGHQIFKDKTFLCELYACCFSCRSFKEPRMAFKKANWQNKRRFNLPFDRIQNENKIKPRVEGNPIYREVYIEMMMQQESAFGLMLLCADSPQVTLESADV